MSLDGIKWPNDTTTPMSYGQAVLQGNIKLFTYVYKFTVLHTGDQQAAECSRQ